MVGLLLNPDEWKRQWEAFMSAPYIIFPIAFAAGLVGWWLKGIKSDGRIAGYEGTIVSLKAANDVYEARLKFAADQTEVANKAKEEAESNQRLLKAEIAASASKEELTALAAKVDIAIEKFAVANNAVKSAVGVVGGQANVVGVGRAVTKADKERPK
jgi:hypothetical protein